MRTVERNFDVPFAGHIDLDFGAVAASRVRPLDCASGVHLHSGHVHIHVELHAANIDELSVAIAKLDHDFVIAFSKSAFAIDQIHSQIVDGLSDERSARDFCGTEFLPRKISDIEAGQLQGCVAKSQCVGNHRDRAETHGGARDHRTQ